MIIVRISKFVYTYKSKYFCLHNKTNEKIHICCSSGPIQSKALHLGPQENALFQKEISASTASLQLKHRHWGEQCRRGATCREEGQIRFLLLEPIIFMIFSTLLLSYHIISFIYLLSILLLCADLAPWFEFLYFLHKLAINNIYSGIKIKTILNRLFTYFFKIRFRWRIINIQLHSKKSTIFEYRFATNWTNTKTAGYDEQMQKKWK